MDDQPQLASKTVGAIATAVSATQGVAFLDVFLSVVQCYDWDAALLAAAATPTATTTTTTTTTAATSDAIRVAADTLAHLVRPGVDVRAVQAALDGTQATANRIADRLQLFAAHLAQMVRLHSCLRSC